MKLVDFWFGINPKQKIDYKGGGSACVIMNLYLKCLGNKYDAGDCRKVAVTISNDHNFYDKRIIELDNVAYISEYFDFEMFGSLNKYDRKKMILDTLQRALLRVAEEFKWSTAELIDAYNCCIEHKLILEWFREKEKYFLSPDKKYYARVFCSMDSDMIEIFIVFYNKNKEEIERIKILEDNPYLYEIGDIGWVKDIPLTFRINHGFKKSIYWEAKIRDVNRK